jgi:hypothetical protein
MHNSKNLDKWQILGRVRKELPGIQTDNCIDRYIWNTKVAMGLSICLFFMNNIDK